MIHFDHAYPAPNLLAAENQQKIVRFMKEQGIENFYHRGVCHQVMIEEGFVRPGGVVIGADSHTMTYGALGCFSTGLGSSEIGAAWVTGKTWFSVPETILVRAGRHSAAGGVLQGCDAAPGRACWAWTGPPTARWNSPGGYIDELPMHERIIFANMSIEIGAKCGLIAPDRATVDYLAA